MRFTTIISALALSAALCLTALPITVTAAQAGKNINVRENGAAGDGLTKDTRAIQKAVDLAHADSGGTVYFPPGTYLSGTIILKSNVTLYLETGATLLGSADTLDYPHIRHSFRSYTEKYVDQSLIFAEGQHNVGLCGGGTIDGNGKKFQWREYMSRPQVIKMVSCRHIRVEGLTLTSSPLWMQHYLGCEFLSVRGLHVYNHSTWNNDMIDIDCCRNVTVSDCYGNSDDDALTLKSTSDHPTENVTITNCVLGSGCNAIKMGTESNGGFRNISITNCVIDSYFDKRGHYGLTPGIGGIVLEIVDGGTLENVTVSNIAIKNVMVPLFLRFANRARPFRDGMAKPGIGTYRNVIVSDIIASGLSGHGCSVTGLPGHPLTGITLSNLRFTFPGGVSAEHYKRPVPELEAEYPEAIMFDSLPAWGLYCRHAEGLRLENIDFVLERADERPAMVFDDVTGLDLDGFSERRPDSPVSPAVELRGVKNALLAGCRPADGTRPFLRLVGSNAKVSLMNSDFSGVAKPVDTAPGADIKAVFESGNRMAK